MHGDRQGVRQRAVRGPEQGREDPRRDSGGVRLRRGRQQGRRHHQELGDEVPGADAARLGVPEVRLRRGEGHEHEAARGGGVRRGRVPGHAGRVHQGHAAAVQAAAPGEGVHGPDSRVRRADGGHERNASQPSPRGTI